MLVLSHVLFSDPFDALAAGPLAQAGYDLYAESGVAGAFLHVSTSDGRGAVLCLRASPSLHLTALPDGRALRLVGLDLEVADPDRAPRVLSFLAKAHAALLEQVEATPIAFPDAS